MQRFLKQRTWFILLIAILTIIIGYHIKDLKRDVSISSLLPENNTDFVFMRDMESIFGANDRIIIGVKSKNGGVYTIESIKLVQELTNFLEKLKEIDKEDVISISNTKDMKGDNDELVLYPLIDNDKPLTLRYLKEIREKVRLNPLFSEKIVSKDEKSTAIIANIPNDVGNDDKKMGVLKKTIEKKIMEISPKYPKSEIILSGTPILKSAISDYMIHDLSVLSPIALLVLVILLYAMLRGFYAALAPISVVVLSIIWTFGFKSIFNSPLTIVETTIPVFLIATGCAGGIHLLIDFFYMIKQGMPIVDAIIATRRVLKVPVILTAVTDAFGFASLLSCSGISMRNMGIFLTLGVLIAMFLSLFFVPAIMSLYREVDPRIRNLKLDSRKCAPDALDRAVEKIGYQIVKYKYIVFGFAILLTVFSLWGVFNVVVEADELKYLKRNDPIRLGAEKIQKYLGGISNLDIIVQADEQDAMKQPQVLKMIENIQKFCDKQPLVGQTMSISDYIKRINYVLHNNSPGFERIPNMMEKVSYMERLDNGTTVRRKEMVKGSDQIAQFLLLYETAGGKAVTKLVDNDYRIARIAVRLRDNSSRLLQQLVQELKNYVAKNIPRNISVRYTDHYTVIAVSRLIISSQISSAVITIVTIFLLLAFSFRSLISGLMMTVTIITPMFLNFAIMHITGTTLNIGTAIIAAIGIGVGIDFAIHYYSRLKHAMSTAKTYETALVNTIVEKYRSIFANAFSVGLGMSVLILSQYHFVVSVGWITAVSMMTMAISALVGLPAMLAIFKPKIK